MSSLTRRVDRIEDQLGPDHDDAGVAIDLGDGFLRRLPFGITLNHPQIALEIAEGTLDGTDHDDGIRHNPTE